MLRVDLDNPDLIWWFGEIGKFANRWIAAKEPSQQNVPRVRMVAKQRWNGSRGNYVIESDAFPANRQPLRLFNVCHANK